MKRLVIFVMAISCFSIFSFAQDIVPLPVQCTQSDGFFTFSKESRIVVAANAQETALFFAEKMRKATAFPFSIVKVNNPIAQQRSGDIVLAINGELPKEGYTLSVTPDNIVIMGSDGSGLFYGIQTLLQLLPPAVYSGAVTGWEKWQAPCLEIKDYPRFGYRGMMLDVSRQFYDVATVKKYLEWMAIHKLNVFHWHLTDDNGWRIEIKKYPKLTQLGAWRGPNEVLPPSYGSGGKRYGGFYTQQEIKDIIAYAQKLHINIIPEVELPGHARAAVGSYPEIRCESNDLSLSVNGENMNLWCVGREANYKMIENIIAEVAALFPWEYIHIGGDEVNPAPWKECPHCQALMAKEGMSEVMELQAYFVKRVEQIVHKYGKKMIGWDEIVDRGAVSSATAVTAWRSVNKGIEAAQKGHPVVMQPGPYTYLDMKQTLQERGHSWAAIISMERVYSLDPLVVSKDESKLILGVQAGLWGELLDRPHRFPEYQLYPRLCALAEVGWTPQELRIWEEFNLRIGRTHFNRLYEMGIAFRVPPPMVSYDKGMIVVTPPYPWSVVRYSDNDTDPNALSPIAHYPIITKEPWNYRFATFYNDRFVSPVVAGASKTYRKPLTTVQGSFEVQSRTPLTVLADYNANAYVRSTGVLKKGDWLLYTFAEPLNCQKITVSTGIPGIALYYVESGYVAYSTDGENFVNAGELTYGILSFAPPKGVKAVKIVMGDENYSVQNAFTHLLVE